MNLQPLSIEAGWYIAYNQLYEMDPIKGLEYYFEGSSLLILQNKWRLKLIDVKWRPEHDPNGEYQVEVLNFIENFNPKTNEYGNDVNWENPFFTFATKSRLELVEKLEELMRVLPIYEDPRILIKRGIISQPSENFRLQLLESGLTNELINLILEKGNSKIQNLALDHKEIDRETVLLFSEKGINKKVKNKANQKLKSKLFKK